LPYQAKWYSRVFGAVHAGDVCQFCQNHDIMAVVAGVGVPRDVAGEAGIAPYLIALPTATII
jgi:hypothetical protein